MKIVITKNGFIIQENNDVRKFIISLIILLFVFMNMI